MGALPIVPRSEKSKELVDFQDGIYTLSGNFETELRTGAGTVLLSYTLDFIDEFAIRVWTGIRCPSVIANPSKKFHKKLVLD